VNCFKFFRSRHHFPKLPEKVVKEKNKKGSVKNGNNIE
jgi:chemotaxis methyl-accepting protein methylase